MEAAVSEADAGGELSSNIFSFSNLIGFTSFILGVGCHLSNITHTQFSSKICQSPQLFQHSLYIESF
jgi:hypothetical protein